VIFVVETNQEQKAKGLNLEASMRQGPLDCSTVEEKKRTEGIPSVKIMAVSGVRLTITDSDEMCLSSIDSHDSGKKTAGMQVREGSGQIC